ncbi:MAG: NepR family anti-sigma factor [Defluviicoccus sp.]
MTNDIDKKTRCGPVNTAAERRVRSIDHGATPSDLIARHLKDVYNETVREPLPEKLLKLLAELDKRVRPTRTP